MKISCPWKGCKGIIDLTKEFREFQKDLGTGEDDPAEIPWCTHAIICPKCHNPVGNIDIEPGYWITLSNKKKQEITINDPIKKKSVNLPLEIPKHKLLNSYLKDWAKQEKNK